MEKHNQIIFDELHNVFVSKQENNIHLYPSNEGLLAKK